MVNVTIYSIHTDPMGKVNTVESYRTRGLFGIFASNAWFGSKMCADSHPSWIAQHNILISVAEGSNVEDEAIICICGHLRLGWGPIWFLDVFGCFWCVKVIKYAEQNRCCWWVVFCSKSLSK